MRGRPGFSRIMPETMGQFVLLRDSGATPTLWSQFAQSFSCMLPGYRVSQPNVFVSPEKLVMEEEQLEGRCEPLRDLLVCSKQGILRMARKFPGLLDTCPHDLQLRLIILKVCVRPLRRVRHLWGRLWTSVPFQIYCCHSSRSSSPLAMWRAWWSYSHDCSFRHHGTT
jgi:hypothetical protein